MTNTAFAYNLGVEFAQELNQDPNEAQNWNLLTDSDEIPDGDYRALVAYYGDVERAHESAYKDGFNSQFKARIEPL